MRPRKTEKTKKAAAASARGKKATRQPERIGKNGRVDRSMSVRELYV